MQQLITIWIENRTGIVVSEPTNEMKSRVIGKILLKKCQGKLFSFIQFSIN